MSIERFLAFFIINNMNRKAIRCSLCLLLGLLGLISCGEENELSLDEQRKLEREQDFSNLKHKIVGTWCEVKYYNTTFGNYLPKLMLTPLPYNIDTLTFNNDGTYVYKGASTATWGEPAYWKYFISDESTGFYLTLKRDPDYRDKKYPFIIYGSKEDTLRFGGSGEFVRDKGDLNKKIEDGIKLYKQKLVGTWKAIKYFSKGEYKSFFFPDEGDIYTFNNDGTYVYKGISTATWGDPAYWKYVISVDKGEFVVILKVEYEPWNREYELKLYGSENDTLRFKGHYELIRINS